ncbi:ArpU family phage transcriptional regulator [Metabacillus crassostreae]|uniref:ArpU family phage packaging/lysis transcriptional regulator n=1 Tax=Metabacillus crassostreae TaxID=929098 RepID=UPI001959B12C|nr:ArpU family phage packaging/lysis transcriptional regulator [Metabacillus crassostreae]MBM7606008.1 ArpU family phage transcriptional regulator [Metabacillus crassostreae]
MDRLLPEINREETKKAVEAVLEKYRIFKLHVPEEQLPRLTQSFSFLPPSQTNQNHSQTEDIAIKKVDHERYSKDFLRKVQRAVNRLGHLERAILVKRYMEDEEVFDYNVYSDLHLSERKYYRVKGKAFVRLAVALKIEVYEEHEVCC